MILVTLFQNVFQGGPFRACPSFPLCACCVYMGEVFCDQTCLGSADLKEVFSIDSASPGHVNLKYFSAESSLTSSHLSSATRSPQNMAEKCS